MNRQANEYVQVTKILVERDQKCQDYLSFTGVMNFLQAFAYLSVFIRFKVYIKCHQV
jgi:hypothetical protein